MFTIPIRKQNRIKSKVPTKSKYWCGCDTFLIGDSGKCPNCNSSKKGKKEKKSYALYCE